MMPLNLNSKADMKGGVGFTIEDPLQHGIIYAASFVDNDSYLRKSVKSQLGTEMLRLRPLIDEKGQKPPQKPMPLY